VDGRAPLCLGHRSCADAAIAVGQSPPAVLDMKAPVRTRAHIVEILRCALLQSAGRYHWDDNLDCSTPNCLCA
jgi:hypothetical protein